MALVITIASTAEALRFDPLDEQWDHRAQATSHPVEQGVDITDHVQNLPMTYGATVWVLDGPRNLVLTAPEDGANVPFADQARDFFSKCQGLVDGIPKILTLTTGLGVVLPSMVLLGWPQKRDNFTRLVTNLSFQQIRIASSTTVQIPRRIASLQAGGQETKDKGDQSGQEIDVSTLYLSADALGNQTVEEDLGYFRGLVGNLGSR